MKSLLNDDTAKYLEKIDYTRTWSVSHHMRFLMFANFVVEHKIQNVLDVGFGQNMLVKYLEDAGFTGAYTGVDMNNEYVANAIVWKASRTDLPFSVNFIPGDLSAVKDQQFECIILGEVIEHIPKSEAVKFLVDCKWTLYADGGFILLTTPNKIDGKINWPEDHEDEFSLPELREACHQSGFNIAAEFGLWNNTENTKKMLWSGDLAQYMHLATTVPKSILNVHYNLLKPEKSRAVFLVLAHQTVTASHE